MARLPSTPKLLLLAVVAAAALIGVRFQSYSYDECILDHVKGGMSDSAVRYVRSSCETYRTNGEPWFQRLWSEVSAAPGALAEQVQLLRTRTFPTAAALVEDVSVANLRSSMTITDGVATLEVANDGNREITGLRVRVLRNSPVSSGSKVFFPGLAAEVAPTKTGVRAAVQAKAGSDGEPDATKPKTGLRALARLGTVAQAPVVAVKDLHLHLEPGATTTFTFAVPDPGAEPWTWEIVQATAVAAQ